MTSRWGVGKNFLTFADVIHGWSLVVRCDLVHGLVVLAVGAVDEGVGQVTLLVHVVDDVLGEVLLHLAARATEDAPPVVLKVRK